MKWALSVAVAMMVATAMVIENRSHGEALVQNKPFADFPLVLGNQWEGRDLGMEEEVLDILKLSDYMMRVYVPMAEPAPPGRIAAPGRPPENSVPAARLPVWLYVGFYQSQRTGATYHSPKNCLPGAGWQFMDSDIILVEVPGGQTLAINKVVIQKGLEQQIILYWYQDRGRVIASEYWAKGYLVWDAMTKNRSDGSLVRISVPVSQGDVEGAFAHGLEFLHDLWPVLLEYTPDQTLI